MNSKLVLRLALFLTVFALFGSQLSAEPFIGEVKMFAGTFAPRGWLICDGQTLSIASNQALYSLIGTSFGGDGRTSFCLPDLRGVFPTQADGHHRVGTRQAAGKAATSKSNVKIKLSRGSVSAAKAWPGLKSDATVVVPVVNMSSKEVSVQTPSQKSVTPYLALNYIICVSGRYPSRR